LLKEFKSVKSIKERTEEELAGVVGKAKAKLLRDYFDIVDQLAISFCF
jgi:excinuclease ABC subunit C